MGRMDKLQILLFTWLVGGFTFLGDPSAVRFHDPLAHLLLEIRAVALGEERSGVNDEAWDGPGRAIVNLPCTRFGPR